MTHPSNTMTWEDAREAEAERDRLSALSGMAVSATAAATEAPANDQGEAERPKTRGRRRSRGDSAPAAVEAPQIAAVANGNVGEDGELTPSSDSTLGAASITGRRAAGSGAERVQPGAVQPTLIPNVPLVGTSVMVRLADLPKVSDRPDTDFVENVAVMGVMTPILLLWHPTRGSQGKYIIAEGRRRVASVRIINERLRAAGEPEIDQMKAVLFPEGTNVADIITLSANMHRRRNVMSELQAAERLIEQGYGERQIANDLHIGLNEFRSLMRLAGLIDPLRDAYTQAAIKEGAAVAAARLPTNGQLLLVDILAMNGLITMADVKEVKAKLKAEAEGTGDDEDGEQGELASLDATTAQAAAAMVSAAIDLIPEPMNADLSYHIRAALQILMDVAVRPAAAPQGDEDSSGENDGRYDPAIESEVSAQEQAEADADRDEDMF